MTKNLIVIYGGEMAKDVAQLIEAQKPATCSNNVKLQSASERPKKLLEFGDDTVICFVLQTIENAAPTEEGGTCTRFFKRKTHPEDLLKGKFSYAVLGVGDSNLLLDRQTTTAKDCNQVAQEFHSRLEALGGNCIHELGLADERTELEEVEPWIAAFWSKMS
jgi:sulfite reductase alpha subunit-like flavoprotein